MRSLILTVSSLLAFPGLVGAALVDSSSLPATAGGPAAPGCGPPRFTVTDLKVGDGALDRGWPGGVSIVDVDGDRDLDVMATRGYDVTNRDPEQLRPDRSMLYLNDGAGRFSRAESSELSKAENYASGSTWADVDGDGDLDAFVSTQLGQKDAFYRNQGEGVMRREELGDATATAGSNFTSTWVDIDVDGDLDLYVGGPMLSLPEPNLVYRNDAGTFVRVTGAPIENGENNPGAVLWADLDSDGDPDLLVTNSDILRQSKMDPAVVETPIVYRNDGGWRFTRLSGQSFDKPEHSANVAALGDIDDDGDLDLFLGIFSIDALVRDRLFRNGRRRLRGGSGLPGARAAAAVYRRRLRRLRSRRRPRSHVHELRLGHPRPAQRRSRRLHPARRPGPRGSCHLELERGDGGSRRRRRPGRGHWQLG